MDLDDKGLMEEHICNRLSLTVFTKDDFTGGEPIGKVDVTIEGCKRKAMKKGPFYVFTDIPEDIGNIIIRADYYFDSFDNEKGDKVCLKPKPSYPFPPGTTLIRGILMDEQDNGGPKSDVVISFCIGNKEVLATTTTEKGEFVVYLRSISEGEATDIINGEYSLTAKYGGNSKSLKLNEKLEFGNTNVVASILG